MKIPYSIFHILLVSGALLLASCTSIFGEKTYSLTEKDSGKVLSCKTGEFLTIRLAANPTTGHQWKLVTPPDVRVLALCREEFLPPEKNMTALGKGGTYFLKYEVIGPGRTGISLQYLRPWEKHKTPAGHFQILLYAEGKPKSYIPKEGEEFFLIPPPPKKNLKK